MEQNPELRETQSTPFPLNNVLQTAVQSEMLIPNEVSIMSKKTATVSARIIPFIKKEAEDILEQLGVPMSVVVDALYRQIIFCGGIPDDMWNFDYGDKAVEDMTEEEFDAMLQEGYDEMLRGEYIDAEEAFDDLEEMLKP